MCIKKRNSLYIIGNGFDIAHGIDTKYWNFRVFLEDNYLDFLLEFEKLYNIFPLDNTEYGYSEEAQERWNKNVDNELWSEFEKTVGEPDASSMLNYSECTVDGLDLESGLIGIKDTMDEYWRQEYGYIKKLQEYTKEWIEQVSLEGVLPRKKSIKNNQKDYFFNFNYTGILEQVYNVGNVFHIHGCVANEMASSPIIGHCNKEMIDYHYKLSKEADENFDEGGYSIHNAIAEYLEACYKDTKYLIWINDDYFNKLKTVDNVIVIGWSAGDVDIPYLVKIKESIREDAKWTVYYYDEKAERNLKAAFEKTGIINNFNAEFLDSKRFWDM